ncbi:hypothetical protein DSUL_40116 [Desulfovibrionales bacterium]
MARLICKEAAGWSTLTEAFINVFEDSLVLYDLVRRSHIGFDAVSHIVYHR